MTQQRPSQPSDRHIESVSDARAAASEHPAIPHQQSRPGPDDDVMLATGRPREQSRPREQRPSGMQERVEAARAKQERIRRQPGRKAWVPGQHGAWSMLIMPPIVGWVVGGWSWANLLFLPAWWGAYLTYWAWSQWLRTRSPRRRRLILLPLAVYTSMTASLALVTVLVAPYLLQWVVPLLPLFLIAAWEVWNGRERSLPSGLSTTAAASLMAAVTYSLAVGGAGGFLGTGDSGGLPGAAPNGALTGWPWMWLVTASTLLYFCGTVPYIKAMIRERFNTALLSWTVAAHAVVAAGALWLAIGGYLPWLHAALWVVLTLRALAMPLWQWSLVRRRNRPLRPGTMGLVELALEIVFLVSIAG